MSLDSATPIAAAGPLAGVVCVLGLVAMAGWVAWRFGPTLAHVTGWCSWWVAWACGSQGGLRLLHRVPRTRRGRVGRWHALVRQASRPLALGALGATVHAPARQPQLAYPARDPRCCEPLAPAPLTRAAPDRSTRAPCHTPRALPDRQAAARPPARKRAAESHLGSEAFQARPEHDHRQGCADGVAGGPGGKRRRRNKIS
jgi:hypothetical protein